MRRRSHDPHCNYSYSTGSNHSFTEECHHPRMAISELFKKIREDSNDTPEQAAKNAGMSRPAYLKWETGQTNNPKLENLLQFCDAYKVSVEDLMRGQVIYINETENLAQHAEKSHPRAQEESRGYLNLNHDEQALVNWYRHTSAEARKLLHGVMQLAPIPTHDAQQAPGLSEGARSILASHEQAKEKLARAAQQLTRKTSKTKTQEKP